MRLVSWLLSVADVKRDHQLSRQIVKDGQQLSSATFSAMHCNVRAQRLREIERRTFRLLLDALEHSVDEGARPALPPKKDPKTAESLEFRREQKPLDLFRLDFLQEQKRDGKGQAFCTGQRQAIFDAYDALDPAQKFRYEVLSQRTKEMAKENRAQDAEAKLAKQQAPRRMLEDCHAKVRLALLPGPAGDSGVAGVELAVQPWTQLMGHAVARCIPKAPPLPPVSLTHWMFRRSDAAPLSLAMTREAALTASLKDLECMECAPLPVSVYDDVKARLGGTKTKMREKCKALTTHLACDTHKVPDEVQYEEPCGDFCQELRGTDIGSIHARFQDFISKLVASTLRLPDLKGFPIGAHEMFFDMSSHDLAGKRLQVLAWLPAASQRSGRFAPTQAYMKFRHFPHDECPHLYRPLQHPHLAMDADASMLRGWSKKLLNEQEGQHAFDRGHHLPGARGRLGGALRSGSRVRH